jgi:hypothetical protein
MCYSIYRRLLVAICSINLSDPYAFNSRSTNLIMNIPITIMKVFPPDEDETVYQLLTLHESSRSRDALNPVG